MGRGAGGRTRLVHGEGLAVPPVGVGVGDGRGGHRQPWGVRPCPEPTHAPCAYSSPHPAPMPVAAAPSSAAGSPYPMASWPPSLLAPPQRTVLCLHPRDLQERRKGSGEE